MQIRWVGVDGTGIMNPFTQIDYDEPVFRPPSEASSFILQVSLGCSHNKCAFCEMYQSKRFRARSLDEIVEDISAVYGTGLEPAKVFLADGDAMALSANRLEEICHAIMKCSSKRPRISAYATPQNILKKSEDELNRIRSAGISLLYYGVESGNDGILTKVSKGATADEVKAGILKGKKAGFDLSVTWILGLGGTRYSKEHIRDTARLLSEASPKYISALTLMLPMGPDRFKGAYPEWETMSAVRSLGELKEFAQQYDGDEAIFRSNHASNYLPIRGNIPRDKESIIQLLDEALANPDEFIRPEWSRGL